MKQSKAVIANAGIETFAIWESLDFCIGKQRLDRVPFSDGGDENDRFHAKTPLSFIFIPFQSRLLRLIVV
jgi:hypothetical protein